MLNIADDEIGDIPLTEQLKTTPSPQPPAGVHIITFAII